jgi:hypothetical protein
MAKRRNALLEADADVVVTLEPTSPEEARRLV